MTSISPPVAGRRTVTAVAATSAQAGSVASSRVPILQRPLTSYHLVVAVSGALVTLGVIMVFSASSVGLLDAHRSAFSVVQKQVLWLIIGVPLGLVASRVPVRAYRWLAYPLLFGSIVLLFAVLLPGVGAYVNGSRRWIDLGPIQLQPSEPAKLALALWGADLLARKRKLLGDSRHLLVPLVPVTALLGVLIMAEPDMGTTMCLLLVVIGLLFVCGAPLRLFATLVAGAGALAAVVAVMEPYRVARLVTFTDPCASAAGKGYQACNGLTGLASGAIWGTGLGASKQKWGALPNAHTDYIFSVIGEELGLVGTLLVVALFGLLGYAGFRISARTRDPFARLASAAVTTWLVGQAVINIGYVVGLLPVTGVPLPLISFGGTSLVLTLVAVGMLASFARGEPEAARQLTRRARRAERAQRAQRAQRTRKR